MAKVGSEFAYSRATVLLDCFGDTRGPYGFGLAHRPGFCECRSVIPHRQLSLKLIGEFLEPLHLLGGECIHIEEGGVFGVEDAR